MERVWDKTNEQLAGTYGKLSTDQYPATTTTPRGIRRLQFAGHVFACSRRQWRRVMLVISLANMTAV